MSGNSKQRRQYRRKLARQGLTYVPPSDYRRRLLAPDVYLEMPPVFSSYVYPPLTWAQLERRMRRPGQRVDEIQVHDEVQVFRRDPADPERLQQLVRGWYGGDRPKLTLAETIAGMDAPVVAEDGGEG